MKTKIDESKVYSKQMEERAILSMMKELMDLIAGESTAEKEAKRQIIRRKYREKYGGELVKILKENRFVARLGQDNEAGDVVLPDLNIIIECKTTSVKGGYRVSKFAIDPATYFKLNRYFPRECWFAIKWKGQGISGWRLYLIPAKLRVLYRSEGYTIEEFTTMKRSEEGTAWP